MPFGKYRGKTVSEVLRQDRSYLAWFCDNVNGNEGIKQAIRALPGFSVESGKYFQQTQPVRKPDQEFDLPNLGVDPNLSRQVSTGFAGRPAGGSVISVGDAACLATDRNVSARLGVLFWSGSSFLIPSSIGIRSVSGVRPVSFIKRASSAFSSEIFPANFGTLMRLWRSSGSCFRS